MAHSDLVSDLVSDLAPDAELARSTPDRIGRLVGGGQGLNNVYVDIATTDLPKALAVIVAPCHLLFDEAGAEETMLALETTRTRH